MSLTHTEPLHWGYVWINGFSTSSEEEREHVTDIYQLLPKAHLRPDFLASPIYTIQEEMKVRNVLLDHSAC